MAFMDKLGQIANKVGDVAGDTFDYGKAKGKIVLEKGKIKDIKEARKIIAEGENLTCYTPTENEKWEEAYKRFKEIIK